MKLPISLAAMLAFIAVLTLGSSSSAAPGDNAVVHWNDVASTAIAAGRPPASSSVLAAMVQGAVYDAVAAVEGGLEPFATDVADAPGASVDAAVATAACRVLQVRVPAQWEPMTGTKVKDICTNYIGDIPDDTAPQLAAKNAGVAAGLAAAEGMIALRADDHFDANPTFVQDPPAGTPGVWVPNAPTPPSTTPPAIVDLKLGGVTPFTYVTPAYRPDPPYAITTKKYARDVAEVRDVGSVNSSTRTQAQTDNARFFSDNTYLQYSRGLRAVANAQLGSDVRESARLLGYAWVAIADTMIACFEAKYYYDFWRPHHAIWGADTDDNPETGPPDSTWRPMLAANHPEYPSGHGCFTAAVAELLHRYFGTKEVPFLLTFVNPAGTAPLDPRTYTHTKDLIADVADARVWAGLHFRTTVVESQKQFARIARDVGTKHFLADDE